MSRPSKPRFRELVSPAGAGMIAVCFFLPWLKVSCGGKDVTLSGSGIGGAFWFIFGLAMVALVTSLALSGKIKSAILKSILLSCAFVSSTIILYKYISVVSDPDIPFYIPSSMIKFEFRPGAVGVLLGLLLISTGAFLVGSHQWKNESVAPPRKDPKIP